MRRAGALLLALAAMTAGVVGCGGDVDGSAGGSGGQAASKPAKPTAIKIALLPVADVAPVYLGMQKGLFRRENLELKPQFAQGGAAIVPSVMAGDVQFGFGNNVSLMIARARGLPLRIVSEGVQAAADDQEAANALLVEGGGDIESVDDLAGRTFAVSTLKNLAEVTIRETLEKNGVDAGGIKFLEIPFPEMNAAVQKSRADVAWQAEPFITIGRSQGMRSVADPMYETDPGMSIATYFGADPYLEKNPEVVAAFTRAMERSLAYARDHPEEARAVIPKYSELKGEVLERIQLANWSPELNVESIRRGYELAKKHGVVEQDLDMAELLPKSEGD
jgi:NitT/TauT family transport system substrate-binding protein